MLLAANLGKRDIACSRHRAARHVWHFGSGQRQGAQRPRHDRHACQHALVSVQSAFADECQQGRLRRQSRTHVGRGRAHARMGERLLDLWRQGVVKPRIAQSFRFDEARRRITSFRTAATSARCFWCPESSCGRSGQKQRARPKPRSRIFKDCLPFSAAAARSGYRASASSSPAEKASWRPRR